MTALLCGLALVAGAPALKDPPKDEPPILGDWNLVEWLQRGTRMAYADGTGVEFQRGGKRLWRDGPGSTDERRYKLYPKTSPAQIDLIRDDGSGQTLVYPGIFKIEANKLILDLASPGGERPKEFDAARGAYFMTFTRVKK